VYPGPGKRTAFEVTRAFSPRLEKTTQARGTGTAGQDKDGALEKAKAGGYTYLIYPVILHWEDRATEWSGIPDKITVEISVIDVATGAVLDSARIEGKSKWATLGGDHPQDLLEKPLTDYARTLFPQRRSRPGRDYEFLTYAPPFTAQRTGERCFLANQAPSRVPGAWL
jgi:hypothetical protein